MKCEYYHMYHTPTSLTERLASNIPLVISGFATCLLSTFKIMFNMFCQLTHIYLTRFICIWVLCQVITVCSVAQLCFCSVTRHKCKLHLSVSCGRVERENLVKRKSLSEIPINVCWSNNSAKWVAVPVSMSLSAGEMCWFPACCFNKCRLLSFHAQSCFILSSSFPSFF